MGGLGGFVTPARTHLLLQISRTQKAGKKFLSSPPTTYLTPGEDQRRILFSSLERIAKQPKDPRHPPAKKNKQKGNKPRWDLNALAIHPQGSLPILNNGVFKK